ncbi:MAG TPA: hypothetical protein V6C65_19765 [Allocoleopsis sp.]
MLHSKRPRPEPKPPLEGDVWTYRMIVFTLSLTVVSCIVGAIGLQINGHPTPELLTALGTGAIGALAGLLAPSPSSH